MEIIAINNRIDHLEELRESIESEKDEHREEALKSFYVRYVRVLE